MAESETPATHKDTAEEHIPVPTPPEHHRRRSEGAVPMETFRRLMIITAVVGVLSGMVGSYGFVHFVASSVPIGKQQIVVRESSAVIDVAKKVSPSVVSITSKSVTRSFFGSPQETEGAGTGMIVTSDGLILTNRHVVEDAAANYTVVLSNGKTYPASVVSRDTANDIAFVRISASGLPAVKLADSGSVQVGQRVVAIGNALGQFQNTVTDGIISGVAREVTAGDASSSASEQLQNVFQTDAAINSGNSGGPLVNLDGQVVGIDTAVAGQGAQNIGFAIPINDAKPLIASVREKGRIVRPYLGVRYVALDKQTATANDLSVTNGAWIQAANDANPGVVADSPAAKAGLKEGDIITKVAGSSIDSTHSLQSLVGKHKSGDKITLTIVRDGKTQAMDVTLGETPAGS